MTNSPIKLLALDTATEFCAVAVTENETLLAEITVLAKKTHSGHLLSIIQDTLARAELKLADLNGFCVAIGPGSFTGLRIGVSTVKGLALALNKPLVGIRNSDALAHQFKHCAYPIVCLLDARRKEVYYTKYRAIQHKPEKEQTELILPPDQVPALAQGPTLYVGNGALLYRPLIAANSRHPAFFAEQPLNIVKASGIAGLGLKRLLENKPDDVETLTPYYIRKADAEMQRLG